MTALIDSIRTDVPQPLVELITLGALSPDLGHGV